MKELRRIREEYAKQFDFDLDAIYTGYQGAGEEEHAPTRATGATPCTAGSESILTEE